MRIAGALLTLVAACSFRIEAAGEGSVADAPLEATRDGPADGAVDASIDGPPFIPFVTRINLGGPAHTGTDFAGAWAADPGICDGSIWTVSGGINQTVDDALFINHAYRIPTLTCAIPGVPAGNYQVTMLFGPTYYGAGCDTTMAQIFSIELEGTTFATNYNLSADTLGCVLAPGTGHPISRTFTLAITDGTLNIVEVAPGSEAAMLSAIQLVQQP